MASDPKSQPDIDAMMGRGIEQSRVAMENYLRFFQSSMSALPWAQTDLAQKLKQYAEQNVASTMEHAQNLTRAKDPQDLMRIQMDFFQKQMKTLTEQAKDFSDSMKKAATGKSSPPTSPTS